MWKQATVTCLHRMAKPGDRLSLALISNPGASFQKSNFGTHSGDDAITSFPPLPLKLRVTECDPEQPRNRLTRVIRRKILSNLAPIVGMVFLTSPTSAAPSQRSPKARGSNLGERETLAGHGFGPEIWSRTIDESRPAQTLPRSYVE